MVVTDMGHRPGSSAERGVILGRRRGSKEGIAREHAAGSTDENVRRRSALTNATGAPQIRFPTVCFDEIGGQRRRRAELEAAASAGVAEEAEGSGRRGARAP